MANALDAVLAFKEQERQAQKAQSDSIMMATQLFQQARQQAQANQLAQLQMKAGLAEKGLKLNADGSFSRDESLLSPVDQLLQKGKVATAEKAIYEAGGPMPSAFKGTPIDSIISQNTVSMPGQANASSSNVIVKDYDEFGRPKGFIDLEAKKQEKLSEGIPADKVGLYNLSKESIGNIEKMKDVLFPRKEGETEYKAENFNRGAAFQANTPNLKLPLGIQIGPDFIPTESGQDVYRWASVAVSAKQLLQTGVAARPDETKKLVQAYIPHGLSSSRSSLKGLNELSDFYKSFNHDLKTLGTDDLQKKYPGAKEYLNNINQSSNSKPAEISLPAEIKTTSQAVDYLMKNNKMSKEEAINWIRNQ